MIVLEILSCNCGPFEKPEDKEPSREVLTFDADKYWASTCEGWLTISSLEKTAGEELIGDEYTYPSHVVLSVKNMPING